MSFFGTKPPQTLDQDFIKRYWDLEGRIIQLEERIGAQLDELSKRYRRAEQSERRLEEKREAAVPCDEESEGDQHPAILALKRRQTRVIAPITAHPESG